MKESHNHLEKTPFWNNDFTRLKELISQGKLEIVHLISTPRSSSTALERALSNSPDIDFQVNDVWADFDGPERETNVYESLLQKVEAALKMKNNVRVVMKDIADYIPPGEAFSRMQELTQHTIVLVRNPLLQMESLMNSMAKSLAADSVIVGNKTMDRYAQDKGFTSWEVMRETLTQTKDFSLYEEVFAVYFPTNQEIHNSSELRLAILSNLNEETVRAIGYDSLDTFAQRHSFSTWELLISAAKTKSSLLETLDPLLFDYVFQCRITGWDALQQHMNTLTAEGNDNVTYIDSTLYRAAPQYYLQQLAESTDISYSDTLVDWSNSGKTFDPGAPEAIAFYQKVVDSTGVSPPYERPISLSSFPDFIQAHLKDVGGALSTYFTTLEKVLAQVDTADVVALLDTKITDRTLRDTDPIFAFFIFAILDNATEMESLLEAYPTFTDIFNTIQLIKEQKETI